MGDFQANFKRPDAGIRTVEGNVAGHRAAQLELKRKRDQDAFEQAKRAAIEQQQHYLSNMAGKFAGATTTKQDQSFSEQTIGLVTAEQFRQLEQMKGVAAALPAADGEATNQVAAQEWQARQKTARKAAKKKRQERKMMLATLSFAAEEGIDEEEEAPVEEDTAVVEASVISSKKDPAVDTSFLPDQERDKSQQADRQRLEREWQQRQEEQKREQLQITYSYWDGSGHRREIVCTKGDSIAAFLERVRHDLMTEFRELGSVSSDALLYVKEDLIIPQDLTFYDLIATKARGKSGPLFHFDVHDDVRAGPIDSRIEKDESHPGKVVERRWYERNKHIFPASRWEVYDPTKEYGSYTIGGGVVNKKTKKS